MGLFSKPLTLPDAAQALPGREMSMPVAPAHFVLGTPMVGPFPSSLETIQFGMGCFWGAERIFWQLEGVYHTSVGYAGGHTKNPTYEEVCSGLTGHTEVVRVVYNPKKISLRKILIAFWEGHDPTQGMRQGNDIGTQYRSAIYIEENQDIKEVKKTMLEFQNLLDLNGFKKITTEIKYDVEFYFAEAYHQQYLYKNPNGYCGLGGGGVRFK